MDNNMIRNVLWWILIIGGINWGLVGLIGFDVVAYSSALVRLPILARLVYILVGISAVVILLDRLGFSKK